MAFSVSRPPKPGKGRGPCAAPISPHVAGVFKIFIQPAIALGAIAAAWLNHYLAPATIGVMLPTLVDAAGIAAFAIGVSIHGF